MVKAMNGAGLVSDSTVSDGILFLTPLTTGIQQALNNSSIALYPNPVSEALTISIIADKAQEASYTLLDNTGKEMMAAKNIHITPGINELKLDVRSLGAARGVYILRIGVEDRELVKKIIIE
jgi:hypothetical protein